MVLRILGSAAAEGWPAPFCVCPACAQARQRGGKNIRRRTSYQLGESIHIDWGPDSYASMIDLGVDYIPLRHLFITHSHQDHWCPQELAWRRPGFSRLAPDSWLTVYGNQQVGEALRAQFPQPDLLSLEFRLIQPFDGIEVGEDWKAYALLANHAGAEEKALNYLFVWQGRGVLIGNDTGWWAPEVWDFLAQFSLHLVVMDCTAGPQGPQPGTQTESWIGMHHLNCAFVVAVRDEFLRRGALAPDCRFIANHFSHNGGWLHEELEAFFGPEGILVGYDGMEVPL